MPFPSCDQYSFYHVGWVEVMGGVARDGVCPLCPLRSAPCASGNEIVNCDYGVVTFRFHAVVTPQNCCVGSGIRIAFLYDGHAARILRSARRIRPMMSSNRVGSGKVGSRGECVCCGSVHGGRTTFARFRSVANALAPRRWEPGRMRLLRPEEGAYPAGLTRTICGSAALILWHVIRKGTEPGQRGSPLRSALLGSGR